MQTRTLGSTGPTVSALGLGAMGMSGAYGATDRAESIATVHAALDAGVTLIDTGDFYAMGHNELLLAEALRGRDRDSYPLSVKFGMLRGPGHEFGGPDGRPEAVKNFLAYSLTRLGTDHIDIYRPARLDPAVPIEETVGAIKEMIDAGYVRHVGLSEVDAATIRRAHAVHPIADLQIEYSLHLPRGGGGHPAHAAGARHRPDRVRRPRPRPHLRALVRRPRRAAPATSAASARGSPSGNVEHNLALVEALRRVAEAKGCTVAQLAIAWVAAQGDGHRAAGRRPYPRAAGRGAARDGAGPHRGRPRRDREGGAGGRGARRPLPAGVHVQPRRGQLKP